MRMSCQFSTIFLSTYHRINFEIRHYSFILNYPAFLLERIEFLCYFHTSQFISITKALFPFGGNCRLLQRCDIPRFIFSFLRFIQSSCY